ncbi:MAG: transketolase C-terminal domain-containing protein [Xanthobacteraceae bacterium]|nr:transketolase C-terminal domain-containing protein [Xanthobacteraceae bacterium]
MRNTFVAALTELAERNPNLWLLCGDLGFSVLEHFASRIPERYVNVGVAEQNMAGVAAGIALSGKTVFIYSIGNFSTFRCLEQLRNDVCYHGADVKVVSVGAGFAYGSQGYTHHAIEDVAVMSALPGMEVFVPCDPHEVRTITTAIATSGRPSYLRLSRSGEPVLAGSEAWEPRTPRVLRQGRDVVILASGPIASACLEAAEVLASEMAVGVVSAACLKPLDEGFVRELAGEARAIVTVEEHIARGGLYAAVATCLAAARGRPPVFGLAIPEVAGKISTAGDRDALLARAGLSAAAIAQRIRNAIGGL